MTLLQPGKGLTRWRQIADVLRQEVLAESFATGRLPTEPELAERFRVNRHTVRRALAALAEGGLIHAVQGNGTFVAERHIDYLLGRRTRFRANLQREGREASYRMISVMRAPADAATARDLAVSPGTTILQLETIGEADGTPVSCSIHRFPAARFVGLLAAFSESHSITAALAACGVSDYMRRMTRLLARLPTEHEARCLDQPVTRPVLQAEAINVDPAGTPVQRSLTVFAGDRVQLVVAAADGPNG
ncbi:MAG TPA: phosphonate metabolism transcriptional regulator PhnF [Xanthobacteraceae bacterium]|jgi:GntR family phosphonate transport system transcriptional regulator